jgi:hypothetical protein
LLEQRPKLLVGDVLLIESNVELTLNFGAGTLSISKKTDELDVAAAVETLSDVVHCRAGCSLDLITETEVTTEVRSTSALVHALRKLAGILPGGNLLESTNSHGQSFGE